MRITALTTGTLQLKPTFLEGSPAHGGPLGLIWKLSRDPDFTRPLPMWAWILESDDERILVDAGRAESRSGVTRTRFTISPEQTLVALLAERGLCPDDFDRVVMTHLHGDHVGGLPAFSPERVDPGREDFTTINTPKVVGGITEACGEVAATWYEGAIKTVHSVSSAEAAEMAKLLENTFRMINIGLVNELAIMCERLGVDVWEVIDAAATKPFGFMKFTPGPGLGGHCIPIDPLYLSWKMKSFNYNARFIELASEINTNMPRYVVSRVMEALNDRSKALKGSKILVLGAAYKADIDDVRESPALDVIGLLKKKGAIVEYHDPYIPHIHHETDGWQMDSVGDVMKAVKGADAVVIITNHKVYDYKAIVEASEFVFDTRNATREFAKEIKKVVRL